MNTGKFGMVIVAVLIGASSFGGDVLWHLVDCRQGNTFPTVDTMYLSPAYCFLQPSSSTAMSILNESEVATRKTTGWLLMRNSRSSVVYSGCFKDGIGTIYFDAVNHRTNHKNAYKIVLEVATETSDGKIPTDENCWTETSPGVTNRYGRLEGKWKQADLRALRFERGNVKANLSPVKALNLTMNIGGRTDSFYRVRSEINERRPCRFRIRRISQDTSILDAEGNVNKDDAFVLMDNIIVSFPPGSEVGIRAIGGNAD